jgi:cytochrome P450
MLKLWPKIIARKPYNARVKMVASFTKYFENGSQSVASQMTKARWNSQHDAGATVNDIACLEALNGLAILTNTVPSVFWAIFEIYSRPALLRDIRVELQANALHIDNSHEATHVVDLADIKDKCPLLVSTFQEVLRLRSTNGGPTRYIYRDVMLNDQYLLKAGSILQVPMERINRESTTWGEDSTEFNPLRFMSEHKDNKRVTGFLSFGTSPNLCPGRHFATGEIMAVAAMMVLRYDLLPVNGSWKCPKLNHNAVTATVTPPLEGVDVNVTPRKEFAGTKWGFRVTKGKGRFPLIVG